MIEEKKDFQETPAKEVTKEQVDKVIRHHVYVSMAVGLVPIPLVDFAGVTAVQLNMLRVLAKKYGVPFSRGVVKNILSSLVGGAVPATLSAPLVASMSKLIPGIGTAAGVVTMPIIGGATTYAVGKVFGQHFASGGTFLTFDPQKVKDYYNEMFTEGKQVATDMKK